MLHSAGLRNVEQCLHGEASRKKTAVICKQLRAGLPKSSWSGLRPSVRATRQNNERFLSHRLIFTSGHIANYYRLEKADPSFTYPLNCNTFKQSQHDITRKVRYSNMTLHIQTVWWSETSTGNICLNLATIEVQIMKLYPEGQGQCCDHRRLLSLGFPSWSLRAAKHKFEIINQCIISLPI